MWRPVKIYYKDKFTLAWEGREGVGIQLPLHNIDTPSFSPTQKGKDAGGGVTVH